MRFVLDANVALRALLNEEDCTTAERLINEYRQGLHELIAPDFFPVEIANALTRAERRGAIPQGQAGALLGDVLLACPVLYDSRPLLVRATELSSRSRASVFDCMYLTLAEDEQCEFVSADRRVANSFPGHPRIVDLASL